MSGEDQGNDPIPHNDAIESLLEQSGDAMDVVQGETSAPGGESGARRVRKPSAAYRDMESSEKLVIRNVFVTKKMQIEKERKIKMKEREKEKERKDQEQREVEAKEKEQKEKEKEKDRLKKLKEVTGTLPTLPKKEVNAKEKALDEMEEGLISAVLRRKTTASNRKKPLPEGPADLKDLDAALNQSFVDNTSVLCDWNIPEAKMIGHLCKVYWDGEDTWFYARILNYDRNHKKHYVSNPQYLLYILIF